MYSTTRNLKRFTIPHTNITKLYGDIITIINKNINISKIKIMLSLKIKDYTGKEAFEYVKEFFPTTFFKEMNPSIKNIIGLAKLKKIDLYKSYLANKEITPDAIDQLFLLASFYILNKNFLVIKRELELIEKYQKHLKKQYSIIYKEIGSDDYKRQRTAAVSNKIKELEKEKEKLISSIQIDPNIFFEGKIIKPDNTDQNI